VDYCSKLHYWYFIKNNEFYFYFLFIYFSLFFINYIYIIYCQMIHFYFSFSSSKLRRFIFIDHLMHVECKTAFSECLTRLLRSLSFLYSTFIFLFPLFLLVHFTFPFLVFLPLIFVPPHFVYHFYEFEGNLHWIFRQQAGQKWDRKFCNGGSQKVEACVALRHTWRDELICLWSRITDTCRK
jgi:hypothetical protein